MGHLIASLSAHGFGHIGQTAPVIRELLRRNKELSITLRTSAPDYKLMEHLHRRLPHQSIATDVGMIQATALEIDLERTAVAYAQFHNDWDLKVEQEARALLAAKPDLVISNISYLTLAGAARAGIPSIALGNINWAVLYDQLFGGHRSEAPVILQQMQDAYASAITFLQPAPSMPMPALHNGHPIGPIAQMGRSRRKEIFGRLKVNSETRLVLISLGGMELRPLVEKWPRQPGVHVMAPASWEADHPDISASEMLDIPFIDLLASCDALIAKPGYGSFVEAACTGIPVLYLPRYDWPEAQYLVTWLQSHGRCLALEKSHFMAGDIKGALDELWSTTAPIRPEPTGIDESVECIQQILGNCSASTARQKGDH